jgi:G3E family GTPase
MTDADNKIPVLILTGFLGVGKTTYLNAILADEVKTAIVINEFGTEPVDSYLISKQALPMTVLGGGCLCCSVKGVLTPTLKNLWLKWSSSKREGESAFERMIIETSGLADPSVLIDTLLTNRWVKERYSLVGIVTLFSVTDGLELMSRFSEIRAQLLWGDAIYLTHHESVSETSLRQVENCLLEKFPSKQMIKKPFLWMELVSELSRHTVPFSPIANPHQQRLASYSLIWEGIVALEALNHHLSALVSDQMAQIVRLKGVVHCLEHQYPVAIQAGAGTLYKASLLSEIDLKQWDDKSRLVLIFDESARETLRLWLGRFNELGCQNLLLQV